LGCDGKFLKKHLEKKFSKGMSWNNYGEWHVDHIIPDSINDPMEYYKVNDQGVTMLSGDEKIDLYFNSSKV